MSDLYAMAITLIEYICIWHIVSAVCLFKLAEKAELNNTWMAFVPFLKFLLFIRIIKWPDKTVIWYYAILFISLFVMTQRGIYIGDLFGIIDSCITILICIFVIIVSMWFVQFLHAFGMSGAWILIIFMPFINIIGLFVLLIYMAFAKKVNYKFKDKPIMKFNLFKKETNHRGIC